MNPYRTPLTIENSPQKHGARRLRPYVVAWSLGTFSLSGFMLVETITSFAMPGLLLLWVLVYAVGSVLAASVSAPIVVRYRALALVSSLAVLVVQFHVWAAIANLGPGGTQ
ncbi:hypothetical protein Rcae01_06436 [Novipirellula caenicola]|uniref:Uncharacterized protein n=1 Tax=Novipirellula caenicola TaxID=1536901 RepID=A0ABP9W0L8_9BACT